MNTNAKHTQLPAKFFIGCDGNLFDTSKKDWHRGEPVRKAYRYTFGRIENLSQLKATIRNGQFAWPGGYPMFFITRDGAALCFDCAKSQFRQIASDFMDNSSTGWRIEACDINYEDADCFCAHCSKQIEPAYGTSAQGKEN